MKTIRKSRELLDEPIFPIELKSLYLIQIAEIEKRMSSNPDLNANLDEEEVSLKKIYLDIEEVSGINKQMESSRTEKHANLFAKITRALTGIFNK